MIKVLIADDHLLLAESLQYMLRQSQVMEVVGLASGGDEAVEKCKALSPHVVLMDIKMAGRDGFSAAAEIKEANPKCKVIMLTTFENSEHVLKAVTQGVDGYILKDVRPESLILAIQCAYHGFTVMHGLASSALRRELAERPAKNQGDGRPELKADDLAIIRLIACGKSNREIAEALNYSEGTIKNKISKILENQGLKDRTQLVVYALKNDLV